MSNGYLEAGKEQRKPQDPLPAIGRQPPDRDKLQKPLDKSFLTRVKSSSTTGVELLTCRGIVCTTVTARGHFLRRVSEPFLIGEGEAVCLGLLGLTHGGRPAEADRSMVCGVCLAACRNQPGGKGQAFRHDPNQERSQQYHRILRDVHIVFLSSWLWHLACRYYQFHSIQPPHAVRPISLTSTPIPYTINRQVIARRPLTGGDSERGAPRRPSATHGRTSD